MISIKEINDLPEAEALWRALSPNKIIFDEWDFRYCFYKHDPLPLHFLAAYDETELVGLLPLQYSQQFKCLEFFAENFIENNHPFFKPGYEYLSEELLNYNFEYPVKIYDLDGDDDYLSALPVEDYVYYLNLDGLNSFDEYLQKYFSDRRKRAKFRRVSSLLEEAHTIKVNYNDFNDLALIIELNVKNFGDESYLKSAKEYQPFYDLLKLPFAWQVVTITADGVKVAGSLSVLYKGIYYYLIAGADREAVSDIFKYLTRVNLELALKAGANIFNSSLGDCNWKNHWHMDKYPQYKFIKLSE
jgi:hypothetical protein